jgi:hypothetical protein
MGRPSKLKLPMAQLPVITVFTRKEVRPVQTALPQSLRGQEDLHTGTILNYHCCHGAISSRFII